MTATAIEWADRVWNPVTGCRKVSAGCANCYAEDVARRFWGSRQFTDILTHLDRLDAPLRWRKPSRIFVNSMSDLFHEDVPDEFIGAVLDRLDAAPQHTFLVLTKRPERMRRILRDPTPRNLHLGVSVENQETAEERIPILLDTPAAVRWVSAEPLLGPVEFSDVTKRSDCVRQLGQKALDGIDWIVVGGESGPRARPCDVAWVRSIVGQCRDAGVPVFVKQLGASCWDDVGAIHRREGMPGVGAPELERQAGEKPLRAIWRPRDPKGGDPSEWPEDLRVRELP